MKKTIRYTYIWVCTKCNEQLFEHDVFYSNGVCPKCGHLGENAGTVVDSFQEVGYWSSIRKPGILGFLGFKNKKWIAKKKYD